MSNETCLFPHNKLPSILGRFFHETKALSFMGIDDIMDKFRSRYKLNTEGYYSVPKKDFEVFFHEIIQSAIEKGKSIR